MGLILGSGRSPGGGIGNPLQYSSLEKNPMDKGAWWATVYGVAKSQIQLSTHTHTHTHTFVIGPFVDLSSVTVTITAPITTAVGLLLGLD